MSSDAPTFWSHFQELRSRLVKSLAGVVVGAIVAYVKRDRVWDWIAAPITRQKLPVSLVNLAAMEGVMTTFKLSIVVGIFLAFPWITWQVWRFLAPGLYRNERRLFLGTFLGFVVMFIAGAAFCYYTVLPAGLAFLANFANGSIHQNWQQSSYASFVIQFLLAFGVIFELPVAVYLLARLDLISARGMWSFFRYAVVIIFVVAAVLTPGPDPVSQLLMALPLCALYILSIGVCALASRAGKDAPGDRPAVENFRV